MTFHLELPPCSPLHCDWLSFFTNRHASHYEAPWQVCRSEVAKWRMAEQQFASSDAVAPCGTGWRHKVPISEYTGRQHKLVIPVEVPGKMLVLLVGASHLRSLADGIVLMPEDCYTFGVMSTPGACADQLRTEVEHAVLPRISDAVCVMAPSNNLMASKMPKQGGIAFGQYLATVCSVWPTAQVHPSDDMGMPILVESLLAATKQHLEIPAPKPQVSCPVSPKPLPKDGRGRYCLFRL
ncbi:hypothetical protein ABVT39_009418 [Epinephelus coioides]